MLEKDIVNVIMRYLRTLPKCFCWKEHGGMYGTAGIPDVISCVDGRFIAFEVKSEKGKPTVLQEATIKKILSAGGQAYIVRSVDEVRSILESSVQ
ncbi:MAG: VRR-NUC domain-containing protein [Oscillospiraceae bacterium]|nr:VRR-NUC domain-containing protein [Oscillospiraceae bacterium]